MSSGFRGNGYRGGFRGPRRDGRRLLAANDVLLSGLASHDLSQALRPHMAKAIWPRVVGPQVAAVTQAVAIRGGDVLVVRVKNGVWANELTLLKDDIITRLNRALGGKVLSDIYFGASGLRTEEGRPEEPGVPTPAAEELEAIPIEPARVLDIEGKVKHIKDAQLRSRLRDNLMRMAQAAEWKRQHGWQPCLDCGTLVYPRHDKPGISLCEVCRLKRSR